MAAFGLQPDTIQWTGKITRFCGPEERGSKKSGWYIAHAATGEIPAIANFGHWGRVEKQRWFHKNGRGDDYDPEITNKALAELEVRRAEQRRKEQEAAAAKAVELWEKAGPATAEHPYLKRKGVTNARGLKQHDGKLLIPMRGFGAGAPLLCVQSIDAAGDKRFTSGAQVNHTLASIGASGFKGEGTLYVVEGWATGWSVHEATKTPVAVAFNAGNLKHVALAMREKYPTARIIVAADNDRWTTVHFGGQERENPGIVFGQEAAEAARALLARPVFKTACELSGKHDREACAAQHPTDFNDLHLADGLEAVARCLTSNLVSYVPALSPPPSAPSEPEKTPHTGSGAAPADPDVPKSPPPEPIEREPWVTSAPFRPIGYDHMTYYYLPRGTGQIHAFSAPGHRRENLVTLASTSWWEAHFPHGKGADWHAASEALVRACERMGVFRPNKLRGRGCWPFEDDGKPGVILHLGDRLLPPGGKSFVEPESFLDPGGRIYERLQRLAGPSEKRALPLAECTKVLDLFQDLLWYEEASGMLLAGWTVLAPICGALEWRPHVWVVGDSGSGKTTLVRDLVAPLTGGMRCLPEGNSSEAGIRQALHSDGLPVIFDEAEKTDLRSDDRIQAVLSLMRSASSSGDAQVMKGSTHGQAVSFQVRSMFCLASIGGSLRQEADKTRVSLLQLRGAAATNPTERAAHWARYRPKLSIVNETLGRELLARTLSWLRDGRLHETLRVFRAAASVALQNSRAGDQYGTLYAGAWTLMSDEAPTLTDAKEILGGGDLTDYVVEQVPAGKKALTVLLQRRERIETKDGPRTVAVAQLVEAALGRVAPVKEEDAVQILKQFGLRVDNLNGEWVLLIATTSEWVKSALRDTPYADSFHDSLRTIDRVKPAGMIRFHAGLNCRTTAVPIAVFDS